MHQAAVPSRQVARQLDIGFLDRPDFVHRGACQVESRVEQRSPVPAQVVMEELLEHFCRSDERLVPFP